MWNSFNNMATDISKNQIKEENKGFTLVEVMVALVIASVGIIGAYELINRSLALSNAAVNRFGAIYLAGEGIEIARNLRDTNYLNYYYAGGNWDDGLGDCGDDRNCGADYLSPGLTAGMANSPLLASSGGFVGYSSGENTAYKRKITINHMGDYLEVVSAVSWTDGAGNHTETVKENLYHWWQ